MKEPPILYLAAGVCDAHEVNYAPGALLIRQQQDGVVVLAVGSPDDVWAHPEGANARVVELPTSVLMPPFVNAHTHLDLTHIGPQPFDRKAGFVPWVDVIRERRAIEPDAIIASVQDGIRRSLKGGVLGVGDIAGIGRTEPIDALRNSPMIGSAYLETFGLGPRQEPGSEALRTVCREMSLVEDGVRLGLQPHAPYSAGLDVYRTARELRHELNVPLTTHLAETPEERAFIASATGPFRTLLERLGAWDDEVLDQLGNDAHPIDHLRDSLGSTLLAHVHDCPDDALELLAACKASIAYCPRCGDYFGRADDFGPHRYRTLLDRGVTVALGTDSIINLPPGDGSDRMSILDEVQHLHRRDATDPTTLLRMATTNGAIAIDLDPSHFTFTAGAPVAGVIAIAIGDTSRDDARATLVQHGQAITFLAPDVSAWTDG